MCHRRGFWEFWKTCRKPTCWYESGRPPRRDGDYALKWIAELLARIGDVKGLSELKAGDQNTIFMPN